VGFAVGGESASSAGLQESLSKWAGQFGFTQGAIIELAEAEYTAAPYAPFFPTAKFRPENSKYLKQSGRPSTLTESQTGPRDLHHDQASADPQQIERRQTARYAVTLRRNHINGANGVSRLSGNLPKPSALRSPLG
jgi:hypothetical protein